MSVTLRQLGVLVAVVDEGSFGAAADALQMSQSAVSHSVAALESVAGAPLVVRAPTVATTPLGEAVLAHARSALASVRALDATVRRHLEGVAVGPVRLAAGVTASHRLVPELLNRWRVDLPGLDVRLFEGSDDELEAWLETGAVDAAVLVDPNPIPHGAVILARDDFRAVLRSDHPLARETRISLGDLAEDPLLTSTSGCEPQITALHAMAGSDYAPAQRVHETSTLLGMVAAGLGVAIMPALALTMLAKNLVMVELEQHLERTLVFTGPSGRPWHPSVERMRDIAETATTPL
ncbi:LysR family transcriptional regulator [Cryobacterium fucosi]|uniref:LysR family transcriptional regulator n=1 Tax=Cryobacterium fucosi TaxID=1259157 RepID=A0A4V3IU60_9MICO|nr:LysR family transcriptional regulator [Cryobacterium fucosi]TFD71136.1 LysR family transcriptional regulator [Cryobacterium fucosi]